MGKFVWKKVGAFDMKYLLILLFSLTCLADDTPLLFKKYLPFGNHLPEDKVSCKAPKGKLRILIAGSTEDVNLFHELIRQMELKKIINKDDAFIDVVQQLKIYYGVDINAGEKPDKTIDEFFEKCSKLEKFFDKIYLNFLIFDESGFLRYIYTP
jgi:hypothetical protein